MAHVNELTTKFSFVGSLKPQLNFNANLKLSIKHLTAFAAATKVAAAGIFAWSAKMFKPVDAMAALQSQTKANIESLQELGYVASQNNASMESFGRSITVMTRRIGRYAQFGGGAAKNAIEQLGLQIKDEAGNVRDSVDLFIDIADKMQGLSEGQKLAIIQDFGMSADMLDTLSLTREELERMRSEAREMGVFSQEDADAVVAYGGAMTKLKYGITSLQTTIAIGFAPVMTELAESFSNVLANNREWIIKGLQWLGDVIVSISQSIDRLKPLLFAAGAAFVVAKVATLGFGGALSAVFSPVTIITALVLAVILVIDDLIVALRGGESVIADFFKNAFGVDIVPYLEKIRDFLIEIMEVVFDAIALIVAVFTGDFDEAGRIVGKMFDRLGRLIKAIFKGAFKFITSIIPNVFNAVIDWIKSAFDKAVEFIKDSFNKLFPDIEDGFFGTFFDVVSQAKELMGGFFGWLFEYSLEPLLDIFSDLFDAIALIVAVFTGDFDEAGRIVGKMFDRLGRLIKAIFKGAFKFITSIIPNVFNAVIDWIKSAFDKAVEFIKDSFNKLFPDIEDGFFGTFFDVVSQAKELMGGFFGWLFEYSLEPLLDIFSDLFDAIVNLFKGDFDGAIESLKKSFKKFADYVRSILTGAFKVVENALLSIVDTFKDLLSSANPINWFKGDDNYTSVMEGYNPSNPAFGVKQPYDLDNLRYQRNPIITNNTTINAYGRDDRRLAQNIKEEMNDVSSAALAKRGGR